MNSKGENMMLHIHGSDENRVRDMASHYHHFICVVSMLYHLCCINFVSFVLYICCFIYVAHNLCVTSSLIKKLFELIYYRLKSASWLKLVSSPQIDIHWRHYLQSRSI